MKTPEIQRSLLTWHGHPCQSGIVHRHGLVCLFATFCFLLPDHLPVSAADPGSSQDGRAVICGPPRDLAELAVAKSCLKEGVALAKARVKSLTFTVNPSRCFIYPAPEGFEYFAVADLEPFTEPAEPQLPMKTFPVIMDKEAEIYGVEVVSGTYREVQQPVYIVPIPWLGFTDDGKYLPNEALYRTNTFFPGSLVAYDQGNDSKRQHVFVRFFPLQYVPGQRKALLVTQARLKLYYGERDTGSEAKVKKTFTRKKSEEGGINPSRAECVIVCPAALQKEAQRLSDFHTRVEGIRSSVVTTETIETAYEPAEDPPFRGYTNPQLDGWDSITNYPYRLAKQIIAYLQDQEMHPRLAYVTILGDGLLVPPSYYYYFGESPQIHYSWTPTDFLYASPDYDFVPNYAVGRLSVNDAAEAAHVVDKIIRWHRNVRWEWFQNVWLAGGAFLRLHAVHCRNGPQ